MDTRAVPQNIQDAFLNTARRERSTVTVFLLHGAKLIGRIKSFDRYSVLLDTGSQEHLIFKHAISTISHSRRPSADFRGTSPSASGASDPSVEDDANSGV